MKMKKIILFMIMGIFLLSACSQQKANEYVGQGTPIKQQTPSENAGGSEVKEFTITAKQFEFVPSIIEVNKGDRVRLIVTSADVVHGLAIKEYNINERIEPGKTTKIEFVVDKQGTFTIYCSVPCGSGHSQMKGTLIVK